MITIIIVITTIFIIVFVIIVHKFISNMEGNYPLFPGVDQC